MKSLLNIHQKDWCWSWSSNILAIWCKGPTNWKRLWCWERLKAGGEGDDRWWDGWVATPTWWTWVWVRSGSWWLSGKPSMLQSMGSLELATTEGLNWSEVNTYIHACVETNWTLKRETSIREAESSRNPCRTRESAMCPVQIMPLSQSPVWH